MQHVVCRVVRRDSSADKFGRVYMAFGLVLVYWSKPRISEGGCGNPSTRRKPLTTSFRKCHILTPENSNRPRLEPVLELWRQAFVRKVDVLTTAPRVADDDDGDDI